MTTFNFYSNDDSNNYMEVFENSNGDITFDIKNDSDEGSFMFPMLALTFEDAKKLIKYLTEIINKDAEANLLNHIKTFSDIKGNINGK